MSSGVRYEREGAVGVVTLDNAARLNPLTEVMQQALLEILDQAGRDPQVRALLIIGEGRGFCVGADLGSMVPQPGDTRSLGTRTADAMAVLSNKLVVALREAPFPVVSALNGAVAGAGVGLALAADLVVAARSSYFYFPFMPKLGIVPDLGSTWFLVNLLGRSRALGLTLLGDKLSSAQALEWGLVWSVVDDEALPEEGRKLAQRLAELPAHGALEMRRAFEAARCNDLATQLAYEAERQRELIDHPDFAEGVAAFMGRRSPSFGNRSG
ncbi:MAG: enoyl-CoA hydratase-related protein [Aquabacterium sp.]|jgi:2-(1,2-epoxy-1,2-dihydrophenyl)acetyl-CoA isomerase|uniref:enoyl-CoA hydratase-related protein n=1 Tax=Aquabacterium sp. TaxID=1872578 RepID=UPI003BB13803